jgi:hypothetical protein
MLIHELRAMDQKAACRTHWPWAETDMTFFLKKGKGLSANEN